MALSLNPVTSAMPPSQELHYSMMAFPWVEMVMHMNLLLVDQSMAHLTTPMVSFGTMRQVARERVAMPPVAP